jgi:tetratricopeptide (TPR) repeat protein
MAFRTTLLAALAAAFSLTAANSAAAGQSSPKPKPPGAESTHVSESAPHGDAHSHTDNLVPKQAMLLAGYGNGGFSITTAVPQAQAFFSNGMELAPAFAHDAAIAAMKEAVRLDPACAMCLWGQTLAEGPTINYGKDAAERAPLYLQAKRAQKMASKVGTPREQALAKALVLRFRPGKDVGRHDRAYAKAMQQLVAVYPDDNSIAILAADATMVAASTEAEVGLAVPLIETVLARAPDDTPAIHFYIHASEIVGKSAQAEPYADRLAALAPKASHLVHMPSHTFYWVGRYQDAASTNLRAVELGIANAQELELEGPEGVWGLPYHAHNVIFGLGGALMAGDAKVGLVLARPLVENSATQDKAHPVMQLLAASGYFALARFDDPATVLALPEPKLPYLKAAWHYARGEVLAGRGDVAGIEAELAAIPATLIVPQPAAKPRKPARTDEEMPRAPEQMLGIVRAVLQGRAAMLQGRHGDAAKAFTTAAEIEETHDFSRFSDPPAFWYPVRRDVAVSLLAAGDAAGAMRELQASLKLRPKDPTALILMREVEAALRSKS